MEKIKVLIVDDSAFMRKLIKDFLSDSPLIEVIGTARDGKDALKKIVQLKPDVVTLDIEMPVLNGLDALKLIMKTCPLPVVMLSSTTREGEENTILAMQYGAVDFIAKPSGSISLDLHKIKDELVEKVISASKANTKSLTKNSTYVKCSTPLTNGYSKIETKKVISSNQIKTSIKKFDQKLVCIGTSTGGPRALQQVITKLPENINVPIFVVQHMPPGFTKSLASRLDSISKVSVKEAIDGETVKKGVVYIAPGGYHLLVKKHGANLKIHLDQTIPPKNGHRPSVDVMFESISKIKDYAKICVIMTGMGSDGAEGLIKLKKHGETVAIAESEQTSVVFGMPKAAIATNLVDEVCNLNDISDAILKYV